MNDVMLIEADCLNLPLADQSVDLVFCSPPYEAARTYGIDFALKGEAWVDWAVPRFMEHLRVCRGLVAWVVEGQTRQFRWSAAPALLMADLHRRGVHLRKPAAYVRDGIPGSGGPDWLKNKWEFIICATSGGRLPWSDNTACGHAPKFPPGGAPSHQSRDGRVNRPRPLERRQDGSRQIRLYKPPKRANPGNWLEFPDDGVGIKCGPCGGGHMGSPLAHENEAPFPESLAEFFTLSFCPPGGIVLDPFCGSGTALKVAIKHGRKAIGCDVRASQIELSRRRVAEAQPLNAEGAA